MRPISASGIFSGVLALVALVCAPRSAPTAPSKRELSLRIIVLPDETAAYPVLPRQHHPSGNFPCASLSYRTNLLPTGFSIDSPKAKTSASLRKRIQSIPPPELEALRVWST